MKLQFDSQQAYQIEAVQAVTDLFDGQPLEKTDFSTILQTFDTPLFGAVSQNELGVGNAMSITEGTLLKNLQRIQERNLLDVTSEDQGVAGWDWTDESGSHWCPHYSVEMETGTGKTYVYLRTIFELHRKYGFKKFIIVVPSVAIREGVLKNLEITREHFRALYNNVEAEHYVYDAKRLSQLRQFATSNNVQILVINIDAFRKNFSGTAADQRSNVIYKESDKLSGRQPIEFVRATKPIVIIDEPQSVDNTDKAQQAIQALNPLCTLRYSATHKNPYNLVYKLDPIRAYELRLVKQIVVASVTSENAHNEAYIKLVKVDNKSGIKAQVEIDVEQAEGVKRKKITVKSGDDLHYKSGERALYANGFQIAEINAEPGSEFVLLNSGRRLLLGQETGGMRDDLWREQIRRTVERHLIKETQLKDRGIKVLSLFFIDRVANYRSYDEDGRPIAGKFAAAFEECYRELVKDERFKNLLPWPVEQLHNGYFAQDKKSISPFAEAVTSKTKEGAEDTTYNLIMRDKERLLSADEPLRFIFSHSALREGWDNPNVFQICTLNESSSATKKRQEIGRGLRLPVNQDGERVFDESINKLVIVANESYEDFAKSLQTEYEDDCGVTFGKVPMLAFAKLEHLDGEETKALGRTGSEAIWSALKSSGIVDNSGRISSSFDPKKPGLEFDLPEPYQELKDEVLDVLATYQLERHIKRDEVPKKLVFKKAVALDTEFQELWNRIKHRTTYAVEYSTETLVQNAVREIKKMERIEAVRLSYRETGVEVDRRGLSGTVIREGGRSEAYRGALPDIIAYLQGETELTRGTLVRILKESNRLNEFMLNPQKFMDAVSATLRRELNKLIIDGIKYERIEGEEYEMRRFETEEILSYLNNRLEVKKSVYDAVVYDSEIERKFAERLEEREDIRLFVKLPWWFKIETPIGDYNPDWAIVKHDSSVLYLARETKGTKDFEKLRNAEADKIRCGRRHFEALDFDFSVVTSVSEV
jgi:type III restriction enzyme